MSERRICEGKEGKNEMITQDLLQKIIDDHAQHSGEIIRSIAEREYHRHNWCLDQEREAPRYMQMPYVSKYQQYVYHRFSDVINIPSFDYISKVDTGWLVVGDNRPEIAAQISLIVERYGIGVGMMVLHAQQMNSQHIPLEIVVENNQYNLAQPTEKLYGMRGEQILYVFGRQCRSDFSKLAELNIVKPRNLWDSSRITSHERDRFPCFYCSCHEINPSEVVINIEGTRFGLSRDYSLGFTFSPFGNPLTVMHFLAWDCAKNPFNMNRTPMTVSDLVELTRQINVSIMNFFAGTEIKDYPVINGVSNGWAGNSIYHQHFQFFQPEYESPIKNKNLVVRTPVLQRDDVIIHRLSWQTPVYKVIAEDSINVGLVGNDMAGIWRLLGGAKKVEYKEFPDGYQPKENEKVPVHTQNIYIMGKDFGRTAYILLRDRRRVDFYPRDTDYINRSERRMAQQKENIGVLEATGTMIVDNHDSFREMSRWEPEDISRQIDKLSEAIHPDKKKVGKFEKSIRELFPQ